MYFRIFEDNTPGFVPDELYIDGDVKITDEEYVKYFEMERDGKQFRVRELPEPSLGLFGYVEKFTPEPMVLPPTQEELLKEQILQQQLATAEAIEKQEIDKVEQQLAQAEMFETILQMLEPQGGGE